MSGYLDQLIAFVSAHAWLAYLTIFAVALLEAVPVLGSLIPGSTLILALSALIPDGDLTFAPVLASAIGGALIGDGGAFWAGHRGQRRILSSWPLSRYPKLVDQSEAFFHRRGTLAVFFARFVAPVRAFVPVTAGALGMAPRKFFAINVVAVVLWALMHVLPGVLAVSLLSHTAALRQAGMGAKQSWLPLIVAGAVIAGAIVWCVRRRRGLNVPAPKA